MGKLIEQAVRASTRRPKATQPLGAAPVVAVKKAERPRTAMRPLTKPKKTKASRFV